MVDEVENVVDSVEYVASKFGNYVANMFSKERHPKVEAPTK